jgi:hypothetical protein
MYGLTFNISGSGNQVRLELDGVTQSFQSNSTIDDDGATPIYHADSLEDGDHQLAGELFVDALGLRNFSIDYFECVVPSFPRIGADDLAASRIENQSGGGFNLLNAGPTAQNVPAQAAIVDNTNSEVIHQTKSRGMFNFVDFRTYRTSESFASFFGESLSYSFDGVAIWYDPVFHTIQ